VEDEEDDRHGSTLESEENILMSMREREKVRICSSCWKVRERS